MVDKSAKLQKGGQRFRGIAKVFQLSKIRELEIGLNFRYIKVNIYSV